MRAPHGAANSVHPGRSREDSGRREARTSYSERVRVARGQESYRLSGKSDAVRKGAGQPGGAEGHATESATLIIFMLSTGHAGLFGELERIDL